VKQADEIRKYCIENYVIPSRLRGDKGLFIPVAEVHKNMHLSNSFPAVSAALGADTFEEEANVRRIYVDGPLNGVSTVFVFMFKE